jgi:hypothetical protein
MAQISVSSELKNDPVQMRFNKGQNTSWVSMESDPWRYKQIRDGHVKAYQHHNIITKQLSAIKIKLYFTHPIVKLIRHYTNSQL